MADFTIFYSWQSDAPDEINWKFIEKALREAVEKIKEKSGLPDVPIVDIGMERVPGSPEIATIMFRKIGRSAIFVGDVSLVGEIKGDPSKKIPNGNVSVEMGYAAAYLGWERIICVLNEHYGKAEQQPVDTRNRRFPINYALPPSRDNEAEVFKGLVNDLRRAIHAVYIYDLESAKDAIRLLDINCMNLIAAVAKYDWFSAPDPNQTTIGGPLDTAKFNAAVTRSLDLGLIWTDTAPEQGKYAYHWTYKGKKVLELLGHRAKPAPAKA
ncbi:MAG: hypothetical protein GXY83_24495 [Rhodopirellula sp.]|nr:hypothetical protein [Rhodopirellula sp.]